MADTTALKKNVDKIAYAVGAVLAIAILSLPFLLGAGVKRSTAKVIDRTEELRDVKRKVGKVIPDPIAFKAAEIDELWNVSRDDKAPAWYTEIKPAVLRVYSEAPDVQVVHNPPGIVSIELVRDGEKRRPYLRVTGKVSSKNEYMKIDRVVLERKVDQGDWEAVPGFAEAGDFTYEDRAVEPGKLYAYRVTSYAEPVLGPNGRLAKIEAAARSRTSNELATTEPVPWDLAVQIRAMTDTSKESVLWFQGRIEYWDYRQNKKVLAKLPLQAQSPAWTENTAFGEEINGRPPRFLIKRIRPEAEFQEVQIEDRLLRGEPHKFRVSDKLVRKVDSWPAVTFDFEPPPAPETSEAGAASKPAAKTPAKEKDATAKEEATTPSKTPPKKEPAKPGGTTRRRGF
jgi:hypothetical protein